MKWLLFFIIRVNIIPAKKYQSSSKISGKEPGRVFFRSNNLLSDRTRGMDPSEIHGSTDTIQCDYRRKYKSNHVSGCFNLFCPLVRKAAG